MTDSSFSLLVKLTNKDGKIHAPPHQSWDCGIIRNKSVHYHRELFDRLQEWEQACCDTATAMFGIFDIELSRKSNDCDSIRNRRDAEEVFFLLRRQDGFKIVQRCF